MDHGHVTEQITLTHADVAPIAPPSVQMALLPLPAGCHTHSVYDTRIISSGVLPTWGVLEGYTQTTYGSPQPSWYRMARWMARRLFDLFFWLK